MIRLAGRRPSSRRTASRWLSRALAPARWPGRVCTAARRAVGRARGAQVLNVADGVGYAALDAQAVLPGEVLRRLQAVDETLAVRVLTTPYDELM